MYFRNTNTGQIYFLDSNKGTISIVSSVPTGTSMSQGAQTIDQIADQYGVKVSEGGTTRAANPAPTAPVTGNIGFGAVNSQSKEVPTIPDSVYTDLGNKVISGQMTGQQAQQQLQSMIQSGQYSGSVDNQKLYSPSISYTKPDGTAVKFDNTGRGTTITTASPTQSTTVSSSGVTSSSGPNLDDIKKTLSLYLSPDTIAKIPDSQLPMFASVAELFQGQFTNGGKVNVDLNSENFAKALADAQKDPDIAAKYGDSLKLGEADMRNTLAMTGAEYQSNYEKTQRDMEQQKKDLQEQEAQAGRAYSGFRAKAEENLSKDQTGIIESSKRDLQSKLNTLGSSFESRYGSTQLGAEQPISAGGLSYTPIGGVTGSDPISKKADVNAKAIDTYGMLANPIA